MSRRIAGQTHITFLIARFSLSPPQHSWAIKGLHYLHFEEDVVGWRVSVALAP